MTRAGLEARIAELTGRDADFNGRQASDASKAIALAILHLSKTLQGGQR